MGFVRVGAKSKCSQGEDFFILARAAKSEVGCEEIGD